MTSSKSQVSRKETTSWPLRFGPWLIGALILSAVILVIVSHGEIEGFAQLLRRAAPVWLLAGVILQVATYFSAAAVWHLTLRQAGASYSMRTLVPLAVAKLFSDQALPSGGSSGTAFFVAALSRRGVNPSEEYDGAHYCVLRFEASPAEMLGVPAELTELTAERFTHQLVLTGYR